MKQHAVKIAPLIILGMFVLVSGCSDSTTGPERDSVAKESFYYRLEVFEQVLLTVSGVSGDITITGSAWSDSIVVRGEKRVTSDSPDDALEHLDSLSVEVKNEAGVVSAVTDQPWESDGRLYEVDYDIVIPTDLAVSVSGVNGAVSIDSIEKPVTAESVYGTITLADIIASVMVSLVNGWVTGDVTLPPQAVVSMSVVNGEIDIELPVSTSAMFSASFINGSVATPGLPLEDVVTTSHSLTGRLGEGEGTVDLSIVNGTITARGF